MRLKALQRNWDRFGATDPLYAISTAPQYRGNRWDLEAFLQTGEDNVDSLLKGLDAVLPGLRRGAALDFGCGVGRLTLALARRFDQAVGVDIAPSMLAKGAEISHDVPNLELVLNERADLSAFGDSTFDLVYSDITLLHMEPQYSLAYVREFLRLVRPGGAAVFMLPEPTRRQRRRDRLPSWLVSFGNWVLTLRQPKMEVYGVDPGVVARVVQEAGGQIVSDEAADGAHGSTTHYYTVTRGG